jgi:hypothetical protein
MLVLAIDAIKAGIPKARLQLNADGAGHLIGIESGYCVLHRITL